MQLVFDLRDEVGPAEQHDAGLAPEHDAQQMIEARKVVHMRMGDKDVRQAHQLARRQRGDVAEIEKQRPPFVAKIDVQARVAERVVDETRFEDRAHEFVNAMRALPWVGLDGQARSPQGGHTPGFPAIEPQRHALF